LPGAASVLSTAFARAVDKRSVTLLTIAITIALAGLVAIQVKWIANTLELKTAQFDESVNNALVAVSDRLERADAMQEVAAAQRREDPAEPQ
jgi:hypothetical protein